MNEKLNRGSCFKLPEKPVDCTHSCVYDVLQGIKSLIVDSTLQILTVIKLKIPDAPVTLVHSREVCQYVGIGAKTLYRHEKMGEIQHVKKDHTGKYYSHSDMVAFKKKYHNLI